MPYNRLVRMKMANGKADETHQSHFCALEYRPQAWSVSTSGKAEVVLLVLRSEDESLQFFIHPEWRNIVQEEDLAYIEALLRDFLARAKQHPAALFKQISSLGVGPLVTQLVGSDISEYPSIQELSSIFVQV
jgi:hypothetical protein